MLSEGGDKDIGAQPAKIAGMLGVECLVARCPGFGEIGQGCGGDFGGAGGCSFVRAKQGALAIVILGAGIEQGGVLRADGQRKAVFQRVETDVVAENVAAHREQERMAAAFEALEQIGATEADEAFAGAGKVGHHLGLFRGGRRVGRRLEVVGQAVTRQVQHAHGIHHLVGVESGVWVVWVAVTNPERKGFWLAFWKMKTAAALKDEEATILFYLGAIAFGTIPLGVS